ncbi:MAG: RHS repeat-associated core domain-containing protein, partial [Acidobacteriota bacterium]
IGDRYDGLRTQHFFGFGEPTDLAASSGDPERKRFTGHERDLGTLGGAGIAQVELDYMRARFCSPWTARFLSVDPLRSSAKTKAPQTWHRYSYAFNNPVAMVDLDGQAGIKYFVKTVRGIYRRATRAQAVRKARKQPHAVKIEGRRKTSGQSGKARGVAREANGGKSVVRHDGHRSGDLPHWQPPSGKRGHVHYTLSAVAAIGAAVADKVESATGSEIAGQVTEIVVDLVNPAADVKEITDFAEEIFTDALEIAYDVELDEQDLSEEEPEEE